VQHLRGVRFQWREEAARTVGKGLKLASEEIHVGFIAQEVQAVAPEAVVVPPKDSVDGLYGLKEADLIPILVEAIKDQQKEIAALQTQVAPLVKSSK